ncbi:unnamed protein product [Didymodactylos carnosus]|uniref:Uncharacterized protein n=1 Tax=Didymodactylos carnosus TaxID=1234261 RepID=A0A814FTF3_9BILA|nr:unnamed protein product [Didymodactylos carnosus]CAF1064666.1 unnamed protein product [Didymodactylos carnosus]CAF3760250.1 unnamed protein product [Didymodactylos carnosus]CAF3829808.1 unnamed protein product [Didymodactylos carnosus]
MLFASGRSRGVTAMGLADRTMFQTIGRCFVIIGCITVIVGIILIIISVVSEKKETLYIGISIIGVGSICFIFMIIFIYCKLDVCWNNWTYRTRVVHTVGHQRSPTKIISVRTEPDAGQSTTDAIKGNDDMTRTRTAATFLSKETESVVHERRISDVTPTKVCVLTSIT